MNILYIGDIMGRAGRDTIKQVLPDLKKDENVDLVVAQAENVSHGKGMSPRHMREMQKAGIDFFTGGNHSLERPAAYDIFEDPSEPIVRPANMAENLPGDGYRFVNTNEGRVLVASVLGTTFPQSLEIDNPLHTIDKILENTEHQKPVAIVVNIHCDYSSEKRMFGHYLDGRASLVVGDHWHVPTADTMILPKGTGFQSDVGMCGSLHSSLGVEYSSTIPRWKDNKRTKKIMANDKPYQFNAVLATIENGLTSDIKRIQIILSD